MVKNFFGLVEFTHTHIHVTFEQQAAAYPDSSFEVFKGGIWTVARQTLAN